MGSMSQEAKESFLADLHVGVLALTADTTDTRKGPLTIPIWYDYTPGGDLWFITSGSSRKGHLLTVGTRISLCAQTEAPPYQYVSVEGPVTAIDPAQDELKPMAVRYLGETLGEQYAQGSSGEHSIVVRMRPQEWLAVDYSASN
jgi:nitroimidazol reductase NimA-like FMN-containing flavoprotein (pyridoxamine 5'-phosphate oxidase superfamily)